MAFGGLGQTWASATKETEYEALPQHSAEASQPNKTRSTLQSICSALRANLTALRLISTAVQLVIVAMACFGLSQLVEQKLGRIIRVHRLSAEELSQAGWTRPTLSQSHLAGASGDVTMLSDAASKMIVKDFNALDEVSQSIKDQSLLILTPCRNCATTLPRYFDLVSNLTHPKDKTSIGILVGDESDNTVELVSEFMTKHQSEYHRLTLLRKDFSLPAMTELEGAARHSAYLQDQRRQIMAKARTFLVSSTLEPSVDWVLWLDSDVIDIPTTLFEDLLSYGHAGVGSPAVESGKGLSAEPVYDIITPNIFQKFPSGYLKGYDLNNWAETPSSLRMKNDLAQDDVLVEGNIFRPTGRVHLADAYQSSNYSVDPDFLPSDLPKDKEGIDRFDPSSSAYLGRRMDLDAVGGVATLVRATAHRVGAIFPAFVIDHQVETEGFGVMARKLGARICGLPNYGVLHRLPVAGP